MFKDTVVSFAALQKAVEEAGQQVRQTPLFQSLLKRLEIHYRFLSREFTTTQRMRKIISVSFMAVGLFAGLFVPGANAYNNAYALNHVSTAEFSPVETSTKTGLQVPVSYYGISQFFSFVHPGIDFEAPEGTPVYAVEDGVIREVYNWIWGYGRHIIIDHGNGFQSLYAHLSKIEVKVGDNVNKSRVIGQVGATGWATGDHLHLEIRDGNRAINPFDVLPKRDEQAYSL